MLGKLEATDFEDIFKSIEGPNLSSVVKFALSLGKYDGEIHKNIGEEVTKALKALAAQSPMRKRRVANLGVMLD